MEQLSFISETSNKNIIKQMKKVISLGIVPGAKVSIDGDLKYIYTVYNINLKNKDTLQLTLVCEKTGMISWNALSERLRVV